MKILVTGKDGQLGWELARTLLTQGDVISVGREQMDLENPDSITTAIRSIRPNLIINAAAYTAVDQAEVDQKRAFAINAIAPGILADEAKRIGASIIHYSTDYVFDGMKKGFYTEEDTPSPLNVYGKSKLAGEQAISGQQGIRHLILRTSWVYSDRGKNFFKSILRLAEERNELKIVNDQIGAPTWSRLIAQATAHILIKNKFKFDHDGLYHLTASGSTSWYGFAKAIIERNAYTLYQDKKQIARLLPIPSSEYETLAIRPANSQLCCNKLSQHFDLHLPDWITGLHLCALGIA